VDEVNGVAQQVQAVALELRAYKDSLAHLRSHLDTTLIAPGLMAVVDLQKRMAKIESGQVATRIAILEQQQQGAQSTAQLIAQMNRQASAEDRRKERERMQDEARQRERDELLLQVVKGFV